MSVASSSASSATAPTSLILATVEHLARFAPFDGMARDDLIWLAGRLQLGYFAKGETLLEPGQGEVRRLFIIKQGVVQGEREGSGAWLELHEGESFPLGALLSHRAAISTFRAQSDVFVYELSADDFHALLKRSSEYHDFCTRRIAALLAKSQQSLQAQYATAGQQNLSTPLSRIIARAPVSCSPQTPLRQALETIQAQAISAIAIVEDDHRPVGIFSVRDLIGRVILPGIDLETPIAAVMTPSPSALSPQDHAFEAALLMAQGGYRHVLVVEAGRLVGVLSEKDLFALQRVGVSRIATHIRAAADLAALQVAAQDIHRLAHAMLAQGATSEQLTQLISTLNDLLTTRVIELELARAHPGIDFCWLALGSEGRLEQTFSTDQDNGIIFSLPEGRDADTLRADLLPLAERINHALAACGFPLCKGEVMAMNPKWCLSLEEWQATFARWIDAGDPDALLNASIFFDFRPLFGETALAESLRGWLLEKTAHTPRFLHQMVANALRNRPPLGLVRDFVVESGGEHANTLDLKLNGATPFVDAARVFALACGVNATGTAARMRAVGVRLNIAASEVEAWLASFFFIQMLRLRNQHEESEAGRDMDNRIDPDTLNDLERRILKEAFRQARKVQSRMALDYQL